MDADLTWAEDDLAQAARLYEGVVESGKPVDESWERNGYRWRLIARRQSLPDGRPDAYLTAYGSGSPGRSTWRFTWDGVTWSTATHVETDNWSP